MKFEKHEPPADVKTKIPLNEKVSTIVPQMVALLNLNTNKYCEAFEIVRLTEKEKEDVANNKVCQICSKVLAKKPNHDRHIAK